MAKKKVFNANQDELAPHDYSWLADIVHLDYLAWLKRRLMAGEPLRQIDYHLCQCQDIWLDENGILQFS